MLTTSASYQRITQDLAKTLELKALEPQIARETEYYLSRIGNIKSVDEFLDDTRVFKYAMKAYGLEEMDYAKAFMRKVLTEGIDDDNSFANKLVDKRYRDFAEAFNFKRYGEAATSLGAQQGTSDSYTRGSIEKALVDANFYTAQIGKIKSVDQLLANTRVFDFAMKALGLEEEGKDKDFIRQVLNGGIDDPSSLANRLKDTRYKQLVETFNFVRYGEAATSFPSAQGRVADKYMRLVENYVSTETKHYLANITTITSIEELLANERMLNYGLTAFGLEDENLDKDFLRKLLIDGPPDKSARPEKLLDRRLKAFADAFHFGDSGTVVPSFHNTRQGTVDAYLRQTLEIDAGAENQGVRLALYFERKATGIESALDILADPALTKVVQVALGIPSASSMQDIDKQAAEIERRLELEDLKDPEKLDKFIRRFTMMWELENPSQAAQVPNVLISQPLQAGFSSELLASLQNLKRGGY